MEKWFMAENKWHIKKDDKVKVLAGKDKGKIGKVLSIKRQGGIIETEAPIHCSNVMLMCSKCVTPVRIKMKRLEDGKKVRVCRKCNEIIDS
jgi:large subunit ribosomal protein L24